MTDFAVWRFSDPSQKDMVWDTKYGKGFPGWHIECSAMSMKYLGEHFDLHTGGVDHLQIHHTNEIAQSEAATGKKFVNYWFHIEFLQVNGKKMSKSLGNVYTLENLVEKGYQINAFKYLVVSAYYRTQLNFTFEALDNATNTLNGIRSFMKKLSDIPYSKENLKINKSFISKVYKIRSDFFKTLDNDLNTPLALSELHNLISLSNGLYEKGKLTNEDASIVIEQLLEFDQVLGIGLEEHAVKKELSDEIKMLIEKRETLRKEKKFDEADKIRKQLKSEFSVDIEDTAKGTRWQKV